jgi:hypothetical protein
MASPTTNTTYSVTVGRSNCPDRAQVDVTAILHPRF